MDEAMRHRVMCVGPHSVRGRNAAVYIDAAELIVYRTYVDGGLPDVVGNRPKYKGLPAAVVIDRRDFVAGVSLAALHRRDWHAVVAEPHIVVEGHMEYPKRSILPDIDGVRLLYQDGVPVAALPPEPPKKTELN